MLVEGAFCLGNGTQEHGLLDLITVALHGDTMFHLRRALPAAHPALPQHTVAIVDPVTITWLTTANAPHSRIKAAALVFATRELLQIRLT